MLGVLALPLAVVSASLGPSFGVGTASCGTRLGAEIPARSAGANGEHRRHKVVAFKRVPTFAMRPVTGPAGTHSTMSAGFQRFQVFGVATRRVLAFVMQVVALRNGANESLVGVAIGGDGSPRLATRDKLPVAQWSAVCHPEPAPRRGNLNLGAEQLRFSHSRKLAPILERRHAEGA